MKLFETRFSFAEVLAICTGGDNTVSHAITDLAWQRWNKAEAGAYQLHEENAYVTIDGGTAGYIATIQVSAASINLQKARELYVGFHGIRCPVCLSQDIEGGHIELGEGAGSRALTCGNCGSTWTDIYSLVRIDDLLVHRGSE